MPCYHPLEAYKSEVYGVTFKKEKEGVNIPIKLPCGQCIGCRIERSRSWAVRCVHEAQMHLDNVMVTLTYNDENLPEKNTLVKKHFQDFMKRLRYRFPEKNIRYYMCGEYGSKEQRPHYHALIFGLDFQDKYLWRKTDEGYPCFRSATLEKLWPHGFTEIGNVTFESAAYVARYVMKKITGEQAEAHYGDRIPEYNQMSLKPAIGKTWFEKYHEDVFPCDSITLRDGRQVKTPKYYDKLYAEMKPFNFALTKLVRQETARSPYIRKDYSPERLAAREKVQKAKLNKLPRGL